MATSTSAISLCLALTPNRIPFKTPLSRRSDLTIRSPPVRAYVTGAPLPRTSSNGIVLVDPADAEKRNRLKSSYVEKVAPILTKEFGYKNVHEVPKIEKIVLNCGKGDAEQNSNKLESAIKDLKMIAGQMPVKTRARKSIASFKLREGAIVGLAVTLRGNVMYSFLDRLINLGFPRTRDFQGVNPNSFDGHGNCSIGMKDQSVFPEVKYSGLGKNEGMDVCIITTAKTDKESHRLLALLGMPFRDGGGEGPIQKKRKAAHFKSDSNRKPGENKEKDQTMLQKTEKGKNR